MQYLIVAAVGTGIGLADVALLLLAQRVESLETFRERKVWRQAPFWIVTGGMLVAGPYLLWLMEEWGYLLGQQILLVGYLLPLSVVDCRHRQFPDLLHVVYGVAFIGYRVFLGNWQELISGCLAAVSMLLFCGVVHLAKKDQLGWGDVKMLCVCAFLKGIPNIIYLLFRGLLVAAVYSMVQMIRHRADMKTEYPLAPFLLTGVLL